MKKIFSILVILYCLLGAASCRRATDNGKIDGFWQIREIQYNDGTVANPSNHCIAVQLELLQLDNGNPTGDLTGVLNYHKNDTELGVDFRYHPSADQLYPYGFAPDPELSNSETTYCKLTIERVDSKRLVLRSPIAVITCRKY